jgi:hypothetical protein
MPWMVLRHRSRDAQPRSAVGFEAPVLTSLDVVLAASSFATFGCSHLPPNLRGELHHS